MVGTWRSARPGTQPIRVQRALPPASSETCAWSRSGRPPRPRTRIPRSRGPAGADLLPPVHRVGRPALPAAGCSGERAGRAARSKQICHREPRAGRAAHGCRHSAGHTVDGEASDAASTLWLWPITTERAIRVVSAIAALTRGVHRFETACQALLGCPGPVEDRRPRNRE